MSKHDGTTTPAGAATAARAMGDTSGDEESLGVTFEWVPGGLNMRIDPDLWSEAEREELRRHMLAAWPGILLQVLGGAR